jgi:hypothetical protein
VGPERRRFGRARTLSGPWYLDPISGIEAVAIDWSGAARSSRAIAVARARDGELLELLHGVSREGAIRHVIEIASDKRDLVVGLDFAFSMPAWFLHERGLGTAEELWALAAAEGEAWLAACAPPFWGRPGARKPDLDRHFRATEERITAISGIRPKSVFQVGGAGAVGTGSIRGMPWLSELTRAGFSVWPFHGPNPPLVVEIWPRLLTGAVVKSDPQQRQRYLETMADVCVPEGLAAVAASSEDAFDAAVSALVMSRCSDELSQLQQATDPEALLEGEILGVVGAGDSDCRRHGYRHSPTAGPAAAAAGFLELVPIEDTLGAVELPEHVVGPVVDLPGRAAKRVVRYVRS